MAETGLTASVGVATTKLLAKLASDLAKPDGLLVVEPGTELEFLHPLPVERLWGVGPATTTPARALRRAARSATSPRCPRPRSSRALGARARLRTSTRWRGTATTAPVEPDREAKSIGHEETFAADVVDERRSNRRSSAWPTRSGSRLRSADRVARTVQLKVRFGDFRTITRSRTVAEPTDVALEIAHIATQLLGDGRARSRRPAARGERTAARARRRGAESLPFDDASSASVTGAAHEQRRRLEQSVDEVRDRFGDDAVVPARFAQPGPPRTPPPSR